MPETENGDPVVSVEDKDPDAPVMDIKIAKDADLPAIATVHVKNPRYEEGVMLEVPGLGTVPNMGSKQVNIVQITLFEQATGQEWAVKDGQHRDLMFETKDAQEVNE